MPSHHDLRSRRRCLPAPARDEEARQLTTFRDLGAHPQIAEALEALGIIEAFPIQALTLPLALTGADIIGQAKTGTGKTLAFGIPLLQRIIAPDDPDASELAAPGAPQALVVVPTRELCVQVARDLEAIGKARGLRVTPIYGGRAYEPQIEALRSGVDAIVGTPGRLLDLAQQRHLDLSHAKVLVLDEADEMLDLGFLPDVERLIARTPETRQTMLFSATMPGQVVTLARRYMRQPTHIRAADPSSGVTVENVHQHVFRAHALDKVEMLARMLQAEGRGLTMVFTRTKRTAAKVADELATRGFASAAVHGDLGQGAREQAMRAFRSGKVDVLVATDVAARGIDVDHVTHVVNYQCPEDEKTYLHRIGRTARAGASGTAVTFVDWDDLPRWTLINKALDLDFADPVETYSSSPHFFTELDIPEGTTGKLPTQARTRAGLSAEKVEDLGETGKGPHGARPRGGRTARSGRREAGPSTERTDGVERAEREERTRRTRNGVAVGAEAGGEPTTTPAAAAEDGSRAGAPRRRRRRRPGGETAAGQATTVEASAAS